MVEPYRRRFAFDLGPFDHVTSIPRLSLAPTLVDSVVVTMALSFAVADRRSSRECGGTDRGTRRPRPSGRPCGEPG